MRHFMTVLAVLIVLTFLLAILVGSTRANAAPPAPAANSAPATGAPADTTPLVCLALGGGTGLLAGIVWLGTLRRMPMS